MNMQVLNSAPIVDTPIMSAQQSQVGASRFTPNLVSQAKCVLNISPFAVVSWQLVTLSHELRQGIVAEWHLCRARTSV